MHKSRMRLCAALHNLSNHTFIVSEFIGNGNLRVYIHDKSKPFPWRLRLSFATDTACILAYLHARKCIHCDLIVTSNGWLKLTDFEFGNIAGKGTNGYQPLLDSHVTLSTFLDYSTTVIRAHSTRAQKDGGAGKEEVERESGSGGRDGGASCEAGACGDAEMECYDLAHDSSSARQAARDVWESVSNGLWVG
ncbi:hypothetical protein B0H14DRAFT_3424121 [Mycena olivaceomarginata]|nr:hypothetical protein B0H14DRAFT_3424121 [Mycena olivaceomarginata]